MNCVFWIDSYLLLMYVCWNGGGIFVRTSWTVQTVQNGWLEKSVGVGRSAGASETDEQRDGALPG